MTKPEDLRDFEPELYEQFGRALVYWTAIESMMAELLSHLLKADHGAMYVLNQTASIEQTLKWIRTLTEFQIENPVIAATIEDLTARIEETRLDRNAYAHGVWSTACPAGAALIQTVRLNRSTIVLEELVTLADFKELVERIEGLVAEIEDLNDALGFMPKRA